MDNPPIFEVCRRDNAAGLVVTQPLADLCGISSLDTSYATVNKNSNAV